MSLKKNLNFVIENLNSDWEQDYTYGNWDENDHFIYHPINSNLLYEKIEKTIVRSAILNIKPQKKLPKGHSKLGGEPHMSNKMEWPSTETGPLDFTAQINLREIPEEAKGLLPDKGILYFFTATYDYIYMVSPNNSEPYDFIPIKGQVLYSEEEDFSPKIKIPSSCKTYKSCVVNFSIEDELPVPFSPEILGLEKKLLMQEIDTLENFIQSRISSKVSGYPITFQGNHDVRMVAEAAANSINLCTTQPFEGETGYLDNVRFLSCRPHQKTSRKTRDL